MSATPMTIGPAPRLGEATTSVLMEDAGYEKDDLTVLSDRGVI
jgi:hypothetical protein